MELIWLVSIWSSSCLGAQCLHQTARRQKHEMLLQPSRMMPMAVMMISRSYADLSGVTAQHGFWTGHIQDGLQNQPIKPMDPSTIGFYELQDEVPNIAFSRLLVAELTMVFMVDRS